MAVVQHRSTFSTGTTSITLPFLSSNAAANLLVYNSGAAGTGGATLSAATDNNTNTIANAINLTSPGGVTGAARVDYVASSHAGANTVTAHAGAAADIHIHIWEISGCVTSSPVRATGSTTGATGSVATSTTTPLTGDVVIAFFYDNPANDALTAGSGYSPSDISANTTGGDAAISEYKLATAGGTQTATCGGNGTSSLAQVIVVFIPVSGTSYDNSFALALSTLLATDFSWYSGAFEATAFENTAFFVSSTGNSYSQNVAFAISGTFADDYQLSINPTLPLTISTVDTVTGQLNAVATVPLSTALSAAITGNIVTSLSFSLAISTAQTATKNIGISTAAALATSTALAMLGGFSLAPTMALPAATSLSQAVTLGINGTSSFAITMNEVVAAVLNAAPSTSFALHMVDTSSAILSAVASEQFSLTMAEVVADTLNINATDSIVASLAYTPLGGFTFASSATISASMAALFNSAFSFFGTAAFAATTGLSIADTLNAAGLLTLGLTTGYSLAKSLNAVAALNLPLTANDVVSAAGSTYGVSVPLPVQASVNTVTAAIKNALMSAGISTSLASSAQNVLEKAIALGIVTAYLDGGVINALQLAALVAESVKVVQQLTAELSKVSATMTSEQVQVHEQVTAAIIKVVERLTAESAIHDGVTDGGSGTNP